MSTTSCVQPCAVFYKLRDSCTATTCANIGVNCWNYGAPNTTYDCGSWCCVKDDNTVAIFAVVFVIVGICCCICCGLALYRIYLRKQKEQEMDQQAMYDDDVNFQYPPNSRVPRPYSASNASSAQDTYQQSPGGGVGGRNPHQRKGKQSTTSHGSSYGKTITGEQYADEGTYEDGEEFTSHSNELDPRVRYDEADSGRGGGGGNGYYAKDDVWQGEFDDTREYEDDYGDYKASQKLPPSQAKYLPPQDDFGSEPPSQRSTGRGGYSSNNNNYRGGNNNSTRGGGRGASKAAQWTESDHPFAHEDDF